MTDSKDQAPDHPVACRLDALTPGERDRRHQLAAALPSLVETIRELSNGFEVSLSASAPVADIQELMELESRCCPFLSLHLAEDPEATRLRLTGPPGTKEFLLETFGLLK